MDLNELLSQFHQLTFVPIRYFQNGGLTAAHGVELFSEPYDQDVIDQFLTGGECFCYQVTPESLLYGFLRLKESNGYLVLGPVCRESDLHQLAARLTAAFRCEVSPALWAHCQRLTHCDLHNFLAHIQTLYAVLHREGFCGKASMSHLYSSHVSQPVSPQSEIDQFRNQMIERQMLSCIEYGKLDEIKSVVKFQVQGAEMPEYYSLDLIRSFRNVFIVSTALCSRAAMRGGMDYDAAIEATDQYIARVENMRSAAEIELELTRMAIWYTEQVAMLQGFSKMSALVKSTVSYIRAHLTEKLTVNAIAETLHQNPSYLSHHFKEQTGESISSYIVREKVEEAKRLLRFTEFPLMKIAANLGFSSQQYFQSVFKKQTGLTPVEYRRAGKA